MRILWCVAAVSAVAVSLTVAACGGSDDGAAQKNLKVRVITNSPITAGTWDPSQHRSYDAVAKEMGWNLQIAQAVPYGKANQVLDRWGAEGVDIVFSTDSGFQEFMLTAARRHPDTLWVTMSDLSTTSGLKNVGAYTVDWCQLGFLEGASAAAVSETGKIGAVGALPILPAKRTYAGAKLGAKKINPQATIDLQYSGDFLDAQKAQGVADAQMANGADVIFTITHGATSPQVAARVQANKKLYVGEYANEMKYAPRATVTSVVLDLRLGYKRVAEQALAGSFKPGIYRRGIAEGFLRLTPFRLGHEEAEKEVRRLVDQIKSGVLKIPTNC